MLALPSFFGWVPGDADANTDFIERMMAAGLLVFGRESIGELRAVVSADLADFDGRGQLQPAQEIDSAAIRHVAVDVQEHPARGGDVEDLDSLAIRQSGVLDLLANHWRGAGLRVDASTHAVERPITGCDGGRKPGDQLVKHGRSAEKGPWLRRGRDRTKLNNLSVFA